MDIIRKKQIIALSNLEAVLKQAATLWKSYYFLEIVAKQVIIQEDTTCDSATSYHAGAITEVRNIEHFVKCRISVDEAIDYYDHLPQGEPMYIEFFIPLHNINEYIDLIRKLYLTDYPKEEDWGKAKEAWQNQEDKKHNHNVKKN